jgi:hypothetical protein
MASSCCSTTTNLRIAEQRRLEDAARSQAAAGVAVPPAPNETGGAEGSSGNASQPTQFIRSVESSSAGGGLDLARALQANLRAPG